MSSHRFFEHWQSLQIHHIGFVYLPFYFSGKCHFQRQHVSATVRSFVNIKSGYESHLQHALATIGPVAVAIDASHASFRHYTHGVYYEKNCGKSVHRLTHAVLVVGYGKENGHDYWLVKNSWGHHYGAHGYVRMARNRGNHCGIATKASYPLV